MTTETYQDIHKMASTSRRVLHYFFSVISLVESQSPYPSQAPIEDVIAQSIKFGSTGLEGPKAPPETKVHFERVMESLILGLFLREHESDEVRLESLQSLSDRFSEFAPHLKWRPEALNPGSTTVATVDDVLLEIKKRFQELSSGYYKYISIFEPLATGRRYFASQGRYVGWVPKCATEGDLICAFDGCRFPFAIRPKGNNYELLGAVYMQDLMEGEASELPNKYGNGEEDMLITLV